MANLFPYERASTWTPLFAISSAIMDSGVLLSSGNPYEETKSTLTLVSRREAVKD
jgi:hypothetical protein